MLSSKEARQLTQQYQTERDKKLQELKEYQEQGPKLKDILDAIERTAKKGSTYIKTDRIKNQDVIEQLKEAGYSLYETSVTHHDFRWEIKLEETRDFWGNKKIETCRYAEPVDSTYYFTVISWGLLSDFMWDKNRYRKV